MKLQVGREKALNKLAFELVTVKVLFLKKSAFLSMAIYSNIYLKAFKKPIKISTSLNWGKGVILQ